MDTSSVHPSGDLAGMEPFHSASLIGDEAPSFADYDPGMKVVDANFFNGEQTHALSPSLFSRSSTDFEDDFKDDDL